MKLLNDNISYLIDKNRLNQDEIADLLQVSRGMISSWIRSKASPKYDKLLLISEKFNVSVDDLLKTDLSKQGGTIGLLGAEIPEITLYGKNVVQEINDVYTTVNPKFKEQVLVLLLKDIDIKEALLTVIKESINIKK